MLETCLLCKKEKPYNINSHFTPAGITVNTFGERNKELIFTIKTQDKIINKYYGRNNPQTESTEIQEAPNVKRGIFCKICEGNLGNYENAVQSHLNEIIKNIGNGKSRNKTSLNVKYVDIGIHANVLIVYFLSIVWRQCLEQILEKQDNPLNDILFEELRQQVFNNIAVPIKEIIKEPVIQKYKLSIFTSYMSMEKPSYVSPHLAVSNPMVFFISSVVLLYWHNENITSDFDNITAINSNMLVDELTLDKSRLAVVNEGAWRKVHSVFASMVARQFLSP